MFDNLNLTQLLTGLILLGSAIAVIAKWITPVFTYDKKINAHAEKIQDLEKHLKYTEKSNKLLCKAMVALIDNKLTGNNVNKLENTKKELMEFLTGDYI